MNQDPSDRGGVGGTRPGEGMPGGRGRGQTPGSNVESAKETARGAAEKVGQQARETTERAKEMGKDLLSGQKSSAARAVSSWSHALHETGGRLESEQPGVARFVHQTADRLDRLSHTLSDRSIEDMARDVEDFARNRPVVVLGGAVLAGFALSRFLKSSAERSRGTHERSGTGYGSRTPTGAGTYGTTGGRPESGWEGYRGSAEPEGGM